MFEEFDLMSVLDQPTKERSEHELPPLEVEESSFSNLEFDPLPDRELETVKQDEPIIHKVTSEDALNGAEMAVGLIDSLNLFGLSPIARWKLKKRLGGKKVVKSMQLVFEKNHLNEELSDKEKKKLLLYNAYLKDKDEILNTISFTDDEKEKLVRSMQKYFMEKNISFNGANAFWLDLAMIEGMKIMAIATL